MKELRVLVCGGREFSNWRMLSYFLDDLFRDRGYEYPPDEFGNTLPVGCIIAGGARGADALAIDYAVSRWTDFKEYPADWERYGRAAGCIRNQQMLDDGRPDIVVAFPGGRGTADMVRRARASGIETIEVKA